MEQTTKTIPEMLREYNALALVAANLGLSYRERKCFKDRSDATKSLDMINSSLRAAKGSEENPGRRRLLESGKSEEIRQQVLADQEQAAAGAATSQAGAAATQPIPTVAAAPAGSEEKVATIMARVKKDKAEATGRRGRAPEFSDDMKITVVAETNPKREGTLSHQWFGFYKTGMLVRTFLDKVEATRKRRADGYDCLRYHTKAGFIKIA